MDVGIAATKFCRRFDEVEAVAIVLGDAGCDREDVGVEDDVFRREVELGGQQLESPRADLDLARCCVGLAVFVERHHDDRRAVIPAHPRLVQELVDALLHRDRVDDGLALYALESRFDHGELR